MAIYSDDAPLSARAPLRRGVDSGGTRKNRARAFIFGLVALAAGLLAAYLINLVLARNAAQAKQVAMVKVAVAAIDLPVATTLRPELVRFLEWPAGKQPKDSYSDIKQLDGRVTIATLVAGDLLTSARVAEKGSGMGIAAVVPTNMRIMAVKVNDVSGLYGWLHPGDYVDVITTMQEVPIGKSTNEQPHYKSKIVLQNIQVKAVGEELVTQNAKPVKVPVVMLLVTPEQSERLALASSQGDLKLTMRSGIDHAEVQTAGVTPTELLGTVAAPPAVAVAASPAPSSTHSSSSSRHRRSGSSAPAVAAAPAPTAQKKVEGDVVEILRGDRLEERKMRPREQ